MSDTQENTITQYTLEELELLRTPESPPWAPDTIKCLGFELYTIDPKNSRFRRYRYRIAGKEVISIECEALLDENRKLRAYAWSGHVFLPGNIVHAGSHTFDTDNNPLSLPKATHEELIADLEDQTSKLVIWYHLVEKWCLAKLA